MEIKREREKEAKTVAEITRYTHRERESEYVI
jgi:hypothetical protein